MRIFLKTHLFLSVLKTPFSCYRVDGWKRELCENADVTASIYDVSEHAHGSLGVAQGHFDCLFSFVKVR